MEFLNNGFKISNRIRIPKIIRSSNGEITIRTKNYIDGTVEISGDTLIFISTDPKFECLLKSKEIDKDIIKQEVCDYIISTYMKYLTDRKNSLYNDKIIIEFIKSIKFNKKTSNNIFIIGYKDNYIQTIQNNTFALNNSISCSYIELDCNMDLIVNSNERDELFEYIIKHIPKKCTHIILDIPNLLTEGNYKLSKEIIDYIDKKFNIPVLFLLNDCIFNKREFISIYGEKYKDSCVDRREYIYFRSNRIIEQSKTILFGK